MQVTIDQLLLIIGSKEVEILLLKQQIAQLQEQLKPKEP